MSGAKVPRIVGPIDLKSMKLSSVEGFLFSRINGSLTMAQIASETGQDLQAVVELVDKLEKHRAWLTTTEIGAARRAQRLREAMRMQLREALLTAAEDSLGASIDDAVHAVAQRDEDPYTAAEKLVAAFRSAGR